MSNSRSASYETFVSFAPPSKIWRGAVARLTNKPTSGTALISFPLTGKDEGRGDGFDREQPYPGLSPSSGKEIENKMQRHHPFHSPKASVRS